MRVLAVDDDAVARMALGGMVTALGHECLLAASGDQAWRLLQTGGFDVIITDRVMPDMDGLELCRRIRAAEPVTGYVYVILVSALGDDQQARDGMVAGADDYLAKPLRLRQIELKLIAAERVTALHQRLTRLNGDLRRANQSQADLMTMLAHDARQPLSAAIGYVAATLEEWEGTEDAIKRANLIRAMTAARRVDQLIQDVLTMGDLDAGTVRARPGPVPVVRLIGEVIDSLAGPVPVTLTGDPSARGQIDQGHLHQIMANLIGNAVKYGTAPITVVVRPAERAAAEVAALEIIVRDSGEGVPVEFVPRLFERFTRAGTGIATRRPGTGFGLYIVRSLIEANHGEISYCPGTPVGACFTVTVPAAPSLRP